jgi:hypothetical protein
MKTVAKIFKVVNFDSRLFQTTLEFLENQKHSSLFMYWVIIFKKTANKYKNMLHVLTSIKILKHNPTQT